MFLSLTQNRNDLTFMYPNLGQKAAGVDETDSSGLLGI